ncbi:MAG: pseudaminic acid cytidylyltransferase [Thermodesulfobacteriota bacterium]
MNVAIIPARGGSKRIPGKNIREFAGRPIIAWSIAAARESGLFARVIVSTDCAEIAAVARRSGAETPFVRPAAIADDFTPTADVLLHALAWLAAEGTEPEYLCCLYATAPFVRSADLVAGYERIVASGAASVFPVTTYPASIFRALKITEEGRLAMLWPEHELSRSNDLPTAYHDAGQFYWLHARRFQTGRKIYADDAVGLVVDRHAVQDIDTPEDWRTAELLFTALRMREPDSTEVVR